MASPPLILLSSLVLILFARLPSLAAKSCSSDKLSQKYSFASCAQLPHLNATLHWTYNTTTSLLSVAYTAPPVGPDGWVAWGINPTGSGMLGTQALIAFKPTPGAAVGVKTYNVSGFTLSSTGDAIAFKTSGLSAELERDGKFRLFGKMQLPAGMTVVNHTWQNGAAVTAGSPQKHLLDADHIQSFGQLDLLGSGAPGPAMARAPGMMPAPQSGDLMPPPGAEAMAPGGKKSPATALTVGVWSMVAGVVLSGFSLFFV